MKWLVQCKKSIWLVGGADQRDKNQIILLLSHKCNSVQKKKQKKNKIIRTLLFKILSNRILQCDWWRSFFISLQKFSIQNLYRNPFQIILHKNWRHFLLEIIEIDTGEFCLYCVCKVPQLRAKNKKIKKLQWPNSEKLVGNFNFSTVDKLDLLLDTVVTKLSGRCYDGRDLQ